MWPDKGGMDVEELRARVVADVLGPSGRPRPEPSAITVAQGFTEGRWRTWPCWLLQQRSSIFKLGVIPHRGASAWPVLLTTELGVQPVQACPAWYPGFWMDLYKQQPGFHSLHHVSTFLNFWETGSIMMCGGVWKDDKRRNHISLVWAWRAGVPVSSDSNTSPFPLNQNSGGWGLCGKYALGGGAGW